MINKTPKAIVRLWSTFSGPLFTTASIPPDILARFKVTLLFWIRIIKTKSTDTITSIIIKIFIIVI